jgi:Xaa-Pro aminopeptidase
MSIEEPVDIAYFTNLTLSMGKLLMFPKSPWKLFVDGRYLEAVREVYPTHVEPLDRWEESVKSLSCLGVDGALLSWETVSSYQMLTRVISFPSWSMPFRQIKDREEVVKLRRAAKLTLEGIQWSMGRLQEGMSERDLAWIFEVFCRERGGEQLSFSPIVAFGKNSAYPHYRPSKDVTWRRGQIVLIDAGVVIEGYAGDLTRCFHVPDPLRQLEQWVYQAGKQALAHVKAGALVKEIDQAAREVFRKEGVESSFLHSLGHGIGLDVHELPRISSKKESGDVRLQEGMVVTIEPGLYREGLGGVRLEEMVLVTKTGYEPFTGLFV